MNSFLKGVVSSVTATAVIVASAPSFPTTFVQRLKTFPMDLSIPKEHSLCATKSLIILQGQIVIM